jgi:hypothetical protein
MSGQDISSRENRILTGLFFAALLFSIYGITYHWTVPFMSGHEFRQAQTAITAYYIDEQNNFSLLYETPILGKPWVSILMEVPVYEWSVVILSRASGLPHFMAARTVSAACFYLTLPAIYLLLGRFALPRPRRLLLLALILTCPVYIYYSRAFLMDAMELMCCAWFLLGFVRTMDERRWSWLALAIVAGTLAALIKSATLAVWLLPAAGYGAWMLWRDVRARTGWKAPVMTLLWGLATVGVALGALEWWIRYTDPIKAAHPSAWIFTAKNLSEGNWGLFNLKPLFAAEIWGYLLWCWDHAIMSRWLIGLGLVAGLLLPKVRRRVWGTAGVFLLAQCMFPFAFAYQDYYFYSCALFLNAAFGFLLLGLLDTRLPRWGCWLLCLLPFAAQATAYWKGYRTDQSVVAQGGQSYDYALRELTPKKSVIIVAGNDWAAMTPLYAQRRALMIRNGLEYDAGYLQRAFADLADEDVCAMVLHGKLRTNRNFINLAAAKFDFNAADPTFSYEQVDVYLSRLYLKGAQLRLRTSRRYPDLSVPPPPAEETLGKGLFKLSPAAARNVFVNITPVPFQVQFDYGVDWIESGNGVVLSAHPNADLWLRPPDGARGIKWNYGIFPGAYEHPGKMTNGVEFIIEGEMPDGGHRQVYYRILDPAQNPNDRGDQHAFIPYTPLPGEVLRFSTRPNGNSAFDWAYWIKIKVD